MHNTPPVFRNRRDLGLWKQIHTMAGSTQKAIEDIISGDEYVHSAVLIEAIEYLDRTWEKTDKQTLKKAEKAGVEPERMQRDVILDVVRKSRPQDCMAAVAAAKAMLSRSDIKGAYEALGIASGSRETRHTSLMLAKIRMVEGDITGARESAFKAYVCDPSAEEAYDILKDVDPTGEWITRQAIQSIHSGEFPQTVPVSGRMLGLYTIYDLWSKGDHERSSNLLIDSDGYRSGEPDYMLAAARMSASERDWPSAMKLYLQLVDDDSPTYLRCEVAEALLSGGEPGKALEVLSPGDDADIRILTYRVRACTSDGKGLDKALEDLLDDEEADWDVLANTTRMLISASRIDEAEKVLDLYLDEHPDNSHALALMSEVRLKQGKEKNAMNLAKKAVRDRKSIPAKIQMARMMLVTDDLNAAEKRCGKVLDKEPFNMDALALKRDILIKGGRHKEALDICDRILDRNPGDADTLIAMSEAFSCLGETEGSVEVFKKALHADLNWDNSRAVIESLMRHGMTRQARDVCMDLEEDFPDKVLLLRLRGNCEYTLEMYPEAAESYVRALSLDSNDPVLWHSKGMAEEAMQDYAAAEESYDHAVILDLSEPAYWISKASIQEVNEDLFGAVESLNRAIELDPMSVYALVRKATIFNVSGRIKEAAYFMEVALTTSPNDRDLLRETIRLHLQSDMAVKALPHAKHMYNLSADSEATELYARCLMKDGDCKTAMDVLSRGLNDNPDSVRLLECRFDCLMAMGNHSEARDAVDSIAAIDPEYPGLARMDSELHSTTTVEEPHVETDEEILGDDMPILDEPQVDAEPVGAEVMDVQPDADIEDAAEDGPVVVDDVQDVMTPVGTGDAQPEVDGEDVTDDGPAVMEEAPIVIDEVAPQKGPTVSDEDTFTVDEAPSLTVAGTVTVDDRMDAVPIPSDEPKTLVIEVTDEEPILFEDPDNDIVMESITPLEPDAAPDMSHALRDAVAFMEEDDPDSAIPLLEAIIETEPNNVEAHTLLGRAYCSVGDIPQAISELDAAMFLNTEDHEVYSLRASIHESMDETDDAIACYKKAMSHGCEDIVVHRSLAYLLNQTEDYSGALRVMSRIMDEHTDSVSDVILYADLARFCGDDTAVTKSVDLFLGMDPTIEETVAFARILDEAGHHEDAARFIRTEDEELEISPSLKKSAEKVMRYAFSTSMSPYEEDPYENCNLSMEEAKVIIDYISKIPDYGRIDEDIPEFEEMELRSMDIILKCGLTELEDGVIPIDLVFTKGGCRTLDDAIHMCSYIQTALRSDADSDNPGLIEIAMQVPEDATLYNIVEQAGVGIYSAKAIKSMSTR